MVRIHWVSLFPINDAQLLYFNNSIYHHLVDQEHVLISKILHLFWKTLYVWSFQPAMRAMYTTLLQHSALTWSQVRINRLIYSLKGQFRYLLNLGLRWMAKIGQMVFGLTGKHFDSKAKPKILDIRRIATINGIIPIYGFCLPFSRIQLQMLPFPHSYELGLKLVI